MMNGKTTATYFCDDDVFLRVVEYPGHGITEAGIGLNRTDTYMNLNPTAECMHSLLQVLQDAQRKAQGAFDDDFTCKQLSQDAFTLRHRIGRGMRSVILNQKELIALQSVLRQFGFWRGAEGKFFWSPTKARRK